MFLFAKIDCCSLKIVKTILALCLLVPFYVFSGLVFPYTASKIFIFRFLTESAAIFYFYLILKYRRLFLAVSPEQEFCRQNGNSGRFGRCLSALDIAILIFALWNFLSAAAGVDFRVSFWGTLERGMGVWGLAHFVLFFFLLKAVFRRREEWRALMTLSAAASGLMALLAVIQHFGGLGDFLPMSERAYSLIGNAGFLGSYLIFNIFLAGYLLLSSGGEKIIFWGWTFLLILDCWALLLSGTRGAWLGLAVGLAVFVILMLVKFSGEAGVIEPAKFRKRLLAVFGLIICSLIVLMTFRGAAFVKNNFVLSRLTSISLSDATARSRLILWQSAWRAWREKPLTGWGGENFEIAADKHFDSRLALYEAWYDRAHNFVFDYGVSFGWPGLLAYLAIFGVVWRKLAAGLKTDFVFSAVFIALFAAYLVQNFFIFDSFVSYLMLFFVLAFIDSAGRDGTENTDAAGIIKRKMAMKPVEKFIFIFLAVIGYSLFYFFNLKPFLAAALAGRILSLPAERAVAATPLLRDALALNSFVSDEAVYQAVLDYVGKISRNQTLAQDEEFYRVATERLEKNISHSPERIRNYAALAWLNLYFSGQDKTRVSRSLTLARKIRELSPNKKEAYLLLAAGYILNSQPLDAGKIVDQASAIDVRMGEEVGEYYEKLRKASF